MIHNTSSSSTSWGRVTTMALGSFKTNVVELKVMLFHYLYATNIALESLRYSIQGSASEDRASFLRLSCYIFYVLISDTQISVAPMLGDGDRDEDYGNDEKRDRRRAWRKHARRSAARKGWSLSQVEGNSLSFLPNTSKCLPKIL